VDRSHRVLRGDCGPVVLSGGWWFNPRHGRCVHEQDTEPWIASGRRFYGVWMSHDCQSLWIQASAKCDVMTHTHSCRVSLPSGASRLLHDKYYRHWPLTFFSSLWPKQWLKHRHIQYVCPSVCACPIHTDTFSCSSVPFDQNCVYSFPQSWTLSPRAFCRANRKDGRPPKYKVTS